MTEPQIRWMIRKDMQQVLAIEFNSFAFPWSEEDFFACLTQKNCIGMVAERNDRVLGFMIYELMKTKLHVLNFAVASWHRRLDVGTFLLKKLKAKLSQQRREEIVLEVKESNLAAQLFFRSQGLSATGILREHYEDTNEDAYSFRWVHSSECGEPVGV